MQMAHSSDDNGKGGFLVPEVLENALIDLKEEFGMFRRYAMNWPMSSGRVACASPGQWFYHLLRRAKRNDHHVDNPT
jgi:HK97 family phage major capsid protein